MDLSRRGTEVEELLLGGYSDPLVVSGPPLSCHGFTLVLILRFYRGLVRS